MNGNCKVFESNEGNVLSMFLQGKIMLWRRFYIAMKVL